MRWLKKYKQWESCHYEARYKNCLIRVEPKTVGWDKQQVGWYFLLDNKKDDWCYNSLWDGKRWDTLLDAQQAALAYVVAR
jgi:hypothetical protein